MAKKSKQREYMAFAAKQARKYNIPVPLFFGMIRQESGWNQGSVSSAGAIGLVQKIGYSDSERAKLANNWRYNIIAGAKELSHNLKTYKGDVKLALAAYNAGPGAVAKYGGVPPYAETQAYIPAVLGYRNEYKKTLGPAMMNPLGGGMPRRPSRSRRPKDVLQQGAGAISMVDPSAIEAIAQQTSQLVPSFPRSSQLLQPVQSSVSPIGELTARTAERSAALSNPIPTPMHEQQLDLSGLISTMTGGGTGESPMVPGGGRGGKGGMGGMPKGGGKFVMPLGTKMGSGGDFSYVDAEGAPDRHGTRHHAAHDWFAPGGTVVRAPITGKVIEANHDSRTSGQVFGGTVKVKLANGNVVVFRHVTPGVKVGQRVKAGDGIARVVGWTDGSPHTHIEVWKTEAGGYNYENMMNPVQYFKRFSRSGGGGGGAAGGARGGGGRGTAGYKVMQSAIAVAQKRGLHVSENFAVGGVDPSVHVEGSYHNRRYPGNKNVGQALDVSGSPKQMAAYWRYMKKNYPNITELFYSPMGFIKNGKPTTLPDNLVKSHYSHVHVAFGPGRY